MINSALAEGAGSSVHHYPQHQGPDSDTNYLMTVLETGWSASVPRAAETARELVGVERPKDHRKTRTFVLQFMAVAKLQL